MFYEPRVAIRKTDGFAELYADTGIPEPAPLETTSKRKSAAITDMTDEDFAALRRYDRDRSGGIVNE